MVADTATSLRRGIAVLRALGSDEALGAGGLGVVRIAQLVGDDKSQASRTLKTLAEYGLVDRDPETRAYRLGWAVFALAGRAGDTGLLAAGEPIVLDLAHALGERAHLTVLRGSDVLTVLSYATPHTIQAAGWVGRTVPAYCTASGHALLVDHRRDALRQLFRGARLARLAPNTPRSIEELAERIDAARARGWAVADEEFEPGLVAVAAPVRDFRERIVAALNVSAPRFRFDEQLDKAAPRVVEAANALSAELGSRHDDGAAALAAP